MTRQNKLARKSRVGLAISVAGVILLSVGCYFLTLTGVKGGLIFFFGG